MPHCAVIGCTNQSKNRNKANSGISYHKFPDDPDLKDKWIRATGRRLWSPQNHDAICSDHFKTDSFIQKRHRTFLNLDAIPTLQLYPIFYKIYTLTKSNNSHNIADLAPQRRKKSPPVTNLVSRYTFYEEDLPNVTPATKKIEDLPVLAPEILIKQEDLPGQAPQICVEDDNPPDDTTPIRIKEKDPPNQASAICLKGKEPPVLIEITVEKSHEEPADQSKAKREPYNIANSQDSCQTGHLNLSQMTAQDTIKSQRLQGKRIRESNRRLITKKVIKMENILKCLRDKSANNR